VSAVTNAEWPRLTNEARESAAALPEEGTPTENRYFYFFPLQGEERYGPLSLLKPSGVVVN